MGLPELRAFLAEDELLRLLDEQLAIPAEKLVGYQPTLRQAIALVIDDRYDGTTTFKFEDPLGPWIEAFNTIRAAESKFNGYRTKDIIKRLARPSALAPLLRLCDYSDSRVRAEAFAVLARFDPKPELLDTMVRGVADSSSRVRASALTMLRRMPERAVEALRTVEAKGKAKKLIDEALATLASNKTTPRSITADSTLLDELVEIWNATYQPEVADLIDTAATQLPHEPISARSATELEAQWHVIAKAGRPANLASLLATPWPTKWRDGMKRLEVLTAWRDPRIATALSSLVESPPYHSQAALSFFFELLEKLALIPDVRQAVRMDALRPRLAKDLRGFFHLEYIKSSVDGTKLAKTLAAHPPKPLGVHAAAVAKARAQLATAASVASSAKRTDAELLAEIYAHPESDTARLVYADFLIERGEPRGELIALQCAPQRVDAGRVRALIARHEDQLVGPLVAYIQRSGRTFERGFLATCVCEPGQFARGAHEAAWATIRQITFVRNATRELVEMLRSPRGASLRVLHGLNQDDAAAIASESIEEISYRSRGTAHTDHPKLPNLRRLGVSISHYDREPVAKLVAGPLWQRLERFAINDGFTRLAQWLSQFAASKLAELVLHSEYSEGLDSYPEHWSLTLVRGTPVKIVVGLHETKPYSSSPLPLIGELPPGSIELAIAESRSFAARPDLVEEINALMLRFPKSASDTPR